MIPHHPAPWRARMVDEHGRGSPDHALIEGTSGYGIAYVSSSESDALLIAAAPDLLDAARACLAVMPVNWREDGEIAAARRIALMAIAKAEGRPIPVAPDHGWTTDDYAREDREYEARRERAEERAERRRARTDDAEDGP